jgi:hypothetical protein
VLRCLPRAVWWLLWLSEGAAILCVLGVPAHICVLITPTFQLELLSVCSSSFISAVLPFSTL